MQFYSPFKKPLVTSSLSASWRGLTLALLLGCAGVAQAQAPFSCTAGKSYLFQGDVTTGVEIDLSTGQSKTASGPIIPQALGNQKLNAFGYNPLDNYIWGQRLGTSQVVRVNSDFTATIFSVNGLTGDVTNAVVGDVSPSGIMYLTRGGSGAGASDATVTMRTIYAVDLSQPTLTATALPVVPPPTYITDWAISPVDGNIYALYSTISNYNTAALTLYKFSTTGSTAGTRTIMGTVQAGDPTGGSKPPISASNFGAAFMDAAGNLYVVANETGYIYRIDTPHTGNLTAYYVAASPAGANNTDGARCPATAIATNTPSNTAPLPVKLTSFAAAPAPNRSVQLGWNTASETNNDYFEVQHSVDGSTFTALGRVAGHHTTMQASTYSFVDATPGSAATHYYRLRQVDLDGTSTFSPVQTVALAPGSSAAQLVVAPNPTTANDLRVQVQYAGQTATSATLTVQDLLGKASFTQAVTLQPGANAFTPSAHLAPGAYWLTLRGAALSTPGVRILVSN
jgi:hypothetical protein